MKMVLIFSLSKLIWFVKMQETGIAQGMYKT